MVGSSLLIFDSVSHTLSLSLLYVADCDRAVTNPTLYGSGKAVITVSSDLLTVSSDLLTVFNPNVTFYVWAPNEVYTLVIINKYLLIKIEASVLQADEELDYKYY